ncbi:cell division protein FtsK [Streptomyces albireticuli]|uniref:cell division protein FtsK n=1 Tax=Streptomyces albireticuli TaxID=1940 RepID=UPI001E56B2C0|nr:cell division protein FtsK [Streptomyces albireticuli]MCD9144334.1 cell division protein FtsK [Streptomyces albireticuli]MCD9162023.1 cell division protein FtsK [Streptomyces albireticuli]MCD9193971.1 cell division protein FtsK [Streptomyces albireticuli]
MRTYVVHRPGAEAQPTDAPEPGPDHSADPTTPGRQEPVVVDRPYEPSGPGLAERAQGAKRRPVIPAWVKSRREFHAAGKGVAAYAWHVSAYHAVRTPWYTVRLVLQAPRGAARFVGGSLRWVADAEGEPFRQSAAANEDINKYLQLSRQRDRRVRWRATVAVAASIAGLSLALALYVMAPSWLLALCGFAMTMAAGRLGQSADAPVIHRAVEIPRATRLTSDIVLRALGSLGIPAINQAQSKGGDGFGFTAPITRDGPGWLAEGDLPYGVTVTDIIERREKLASGLRRPLGTVWPESVPDEHTGRLRLWVGDQDMSRTKQPAWPLAKSGTVDLFKPVAWGTDQRGREVEITLMYLAGVIGAIPRMGKTFLLRLLLLIAALDPRAEVHSYDLKGTGDLDPVGSAVSYRHRAGDDDEDVLYAVTAMRELQAELRRRTKVIRTLPRDICPESKVTTELASKRSLRLHPIVVGVDECQKWFEHPKHGKELEEICTDLVKRGPATGIVLLLATQRPDDDSLPKGISANASARWCLKVMSHVENDMVLGTGAYKRGVRATMFAWGDKGICYFLGEGADARIVRAVEIDALAAEGIAQRGRKMRERLGTLAGYALGEQPEAEPGPSYDLLADLLTAFPDGRPRLWNESIVAGLAELRPAVYGTWTPEQLTAALKSYGIRTVQVWGTTDDGKGANRRGIKRADVLAVIAERDDHDAAA